MTAIDRNAFSRARFFLAKADECSPEQRNDFEAYAEACIVFARAGVLRAKEKYRNQAAFKTWWDPLQQNTKLEFLREERNLVVHEAPAKVGQVIALGGGIAKASQLYFYERDSTGNPVDVLETLEEWITEAEAAVAQAESMFP